MPAAAYAPPEWARALQASAASAGAGGGAGPARTPRGYRAGVAHDLWSLGAVLFEVATGWGLWQSRRASDALAPHTLAALASWDHHARGRVLQGLQVPRHANPIHPHLTLHEYHWVPHTPLFSSPRLSSERASQPSKLLRERLDGLDALSDDKWFVKTV